MATVTDRQPGRYIALYIYNCVQGKDGAYGKLKGMPDLSGKQRSCGSIGTLAGVPGNRQSDRGQRPAQRSVTPPWLLHAESGGARGLSLALDFSFGIKRTRLNENPTLSTPCLRFSGMFPLCVPDSGQLIGRIFRFLSWVLLCQNV